MPMSAHELQAKLQAGQAERAEAVRRLERERDGLLLEKHSGNERAIRRSNAIRTALDDHASGAREVATLLARLEPGLKRERAAVVRADRERQAAELDCIMDALDERAATIDAAVSGLADTMGEATRLMEAVRHRAAALIAQPAMDIGQATINAMISVQTSSMRALPELLQERLCSLNLLPTETGNHRAIGPLRDTLRAARDMISTRVRDRIALGHRQAEADAAEAEAELEAAAGPGAGPAAPPAAVA